MKPTSRAAAFYSVSWIQRLSDVDIQAATLRLKNSANIHYRIYGLSLRHCLHRYGTLVPLAGQCLLPQCIHLWKVKRIIDRTLRRIMTTTNVPTIVPIDSKNTILAISSMRVSPIWESLVSSAMSSSPGSWHRIFSFKSRLFAESRTTRKARWFLIPHKVSRQPFGGQMKGAQLLIITWVW